MASQRVATTQGGRGATIITPGAIVDGSHLSPQRQATANPAFSIDELQARSESF
jgi:hypothetical protein